MSLTPELHAWLNGKVAELTAVAGFPGPALPAGFTAKDVSEGCSEWSQLPPVAATSCPKVLFPLPSSTDASCRTRDSSRTKDPHGPTCTKDSIDSRFFPATRHALSTRQPFHAETPSCRSTFTPANYPTPSSTPGAAAAICYRCGRQGHYAQNCNAKMDVEGNVMYSTSLFYYDAPTDPFENVEFHKENSTYDISDSSINGYQGAKEGNTGEDEEVGPTHDDGPVFADFHDGCA
ncbi:hypothetical protein HKX48_002074 [Thoreauomyces humboldtii]|nr:hypothetical protein HKX48_002074 [Thoreauomyces humboldtii]